MTGVITTVAGNGNFDFGGDGGPATSASLDSPEGVAVDSTGDVFISDSFNSRVRRVDAVTGAITTYAGNGTPGVSGDGGLATSASLEQPEGLAIDSSGNLFIADSGLIRRVNALTHVITTVAGGGVGGDGGLATNALLNGTSACALDTAGNLFIAGGRQIRRVAASNQIITTVAGNGTAGFSGDGGPAAAAELGLPLGVAVDGSGNLFISDYLNNRIREVNSSLVITTAAGGGSGGDGGPASNANLSLFFSVATDSAGNVFDADGDNYRLRRIEFQYRNNHNRRWQRRFLYCGSMRRWRTRNQRRFELSKRRSGGRRRRYFHL